MAKSLRGLCELFGSGFVIVCLVAMNTYQVAHNHYVGALVVGFLISLLWTFNVKRVVIGSWRDRVAYAVGAAFGTVAGMAISQIIYFGA